LEHFTLEMPGKDFFKSLPPNGRRQALFAVKRSFEALSAKAHAKPSHYPNV
jgi:hypothetical protein